MLKYDDSKENLQPVHLGRRKFTKSFVLSSALIAFSVLRPSNASAFSHEDLLGDSGGGGGGASWATIVKDFSGGLATVAKAAVTVGYVLGDLAEALGLKQEAALMRAQAKNIEDKGDSLGGGDLEEFEKNSAETVQVINAKIAKAGALSAEQKAKIAEGMAKYVPALFLAIKGAVKIAKAAGSVAGAGTPGPMDGLEAIDAATTIPDLAPQAISFVQKSVEVNETLAAIARENDIAVPDTSGLADAMSDMG